MELLLQTLINGVLAAGIYALVASGLALAVGVVGIVNFAHGEFTMLGAFIAYLLFVGSGLDPLVSLGLAALVLFLVGSLTYYGLIRPVLGAPELNQMLLTFGLSVALQNLALLLFGANTRVVSPPYQGSTIHLLGLSFGVVPFASFVLSVVLLGGLYWFLGRTRLGLAVRAVAQNRLAPGLLGIEKERIYLLAFGLSAALAGVAGVMLSVILYASPTVGFAYTLKAFAIIVMAGLGNLGGVVPAAVALALAEALVSTYLPGGGGWVEAVFFLVIFATLTWRSWRAA
ncbi:High-affinity branched-chain amino acid transport system permease protein LivH [Meiothermus luteus]|jgi:branched-chain amino acid transport system permease protein|uniref:High-affinity branched-chain amino acid transport system permease protein LivH n=1 Tax=Meiothermus luteus TaxID=2026184 RepID=A0A399ENI5_9DEIN|nr:branched-chain amino acid ABC transporter permease [Meiothermus luteus]RIH85083.1 High-affinity branched-chain amino acid transport system permease protein LivH [Meiothermus luteus]RMH55181.1 MAG: branched-chain amino acid ABC transporter permease [Deinococcota bacterium]